MALFLTSLTYQFETTQVPFQFGQQLTISFLDVTYFEACFLNLLYPDT